MGAEICAYTLANMSMSYLGEFEFEDTEKTVIIFQKALLRLTKPRQVAGETSMDVSYMRIPMVGKESTIRIDMKTMAGVLVKKVDHEDVLEYRNAHIKLYSKLHLA